MMQKPDLRKYLLQLSAGRNQSFLKILQSVAICILASLILFTITITLVLRPVLRNQATKVAEQAFQKIETDMTLIQETASNLAVQVLLNNTCSPLVSATSAEALDSVTVTKGLEQLRLLHNTSSYVHSIYILNLSADRAFTSTTFHSECSCASFQDQDIFSLMNLEDAWRAFQKREAVTYRGINYFTKDPVYTYLIPSHFKNGVPQSAVVINMSINSLTQQVSRSQTFQENTMVQVSDDQATLLQFSSFPETVSDKINQWVQNTVETQDRSSDRTIAGSKYSLIYHYSPTTQLHFTMVQPHAQVYGTLEQIQRIAILIMIGIALLSILLSFLASHYIHRMFSSVEQERLHLSKTLQDNAVHIQRQFWQNYLTGVTQLTPAALEEQCHNLKLTHVEQGSLCILALDQLSAAQAQNADYDFQQVILAFSEAFAPLEPLYLFRRANLLVFLLRPEDPSDLNSIDERLLTLSEHIIYPFNLLGSNRISHIQQYPMVWTGLAQAVNLTFFYEQNTYLECEKITAQHQDVSNRSNVRIIQHLSESIINAETQAVLDTLEQFELSLHNKTYNSYINHMVWLAMSVTNSVNPVRVELAEDSFEPSQFEEFVFSVHRCPRRPQLLDLFREYLSQMIRTVQTLNQSKTAVNKIDAIRQHIQENYHSTLLTPNSIAETFALSPDYLRKVFKAGSELSLSDYISQIRLKAAAERIISTNDSLKDIAEGCGFSSVNYFCTCFKKHYGLTPSNYRSVNGKKTEEE